MASLVIVGWETKNMLLTMVMSLLVEDIFDFETNLFKSISSRFFWYDKNFTDCSQSIINEFQTF